MRHLFYECNEIVDIGDGTPYPQSGSLEAEVEEYGNRQAELYIEDFIAMLDRDMVKQMCEQKNEN